MKHTYKTATEILHSQQPTEESTTTASSTTTQSEELIEAHPYNDTKIVIRGHKDKGYFATIGNQRISDVKETVGEIEDLLDERDWNILMNIIAFILERVISESTIKEEINTIEEPLKGSYKVD